MDGVSREAFQDFLRAVEHHRQLRLDTRGCRDDAQLIQLARKHGFMLTSRDLACDASDSRISRWFERSRINHSFRTLSHDGRRHPAQ